MVDEIAIAQIIIYVSCLLGILWSQYTYYLVVSVDVEEDNLDENFDAHYINLDQRDQRQREALLDIGGKISDGANAFQAAEYKVMGGFIVVFGVFVWLVVDYLGQITKEKSPNSFYAVIAYVIGSVTSMFCGYIGMMIAVKANYRTTFCAMTSLEDAFRTAYAAGCVMGFSMISVSLAIMLTLLIVYEKLYEPTLKTSDPRSWSVLMELLSGYGLGGSSIALFGRVGGGIYTKAADVGADLVGKVEAGLAEDSPRNPGTIADNVGDNVGDIAGMGSDLFGSFAESTCAALVYIATTQDLITDKKPLYFPLLISAIGILACILTSMVGLWVYKVSDKDRIEPALRIQQVLSTLQALIGVIFGSGWLLPPTWSYLLYNDKRFETNRNYAIAVTCMGLVSGLLIGLITDYYTSTNNAPVEELANSCTSGSAINIIFGLSLGFKSCVIPILQLSTTIVAAIRMVGMLGCALAALGMLSTLCIGLAIDAYGPVSDNAGGIAEMCELHPDVREQTDALDAAGNTTAAVGKGFAIGSACLVSLALYGAFIFRSRKTGTPNAFPNVEIMNGWVFGSLLAGGMLPYWFSAMTMKAVGEAAGGMVEEIRRQFRDPQIRNGQKEPDYQKCIQVSTKASLTQMIAPGIQVIATPLVLGIFVHPLLVAGVIPGALISGIQMAISMSNTGGAWDNAKKYIEAGNLRVNDQGEVDPNGHVRGKGSEEHKAAVVGDTVGDPLKDTSGPSLNILIKLMAIIALVFADGFSETAFLGKYIGVVD